jgi:hypothetical protein
VDVLSQLDIVEGDNKRKRKEKEQGHITMEVPGKESGPAAAADDGGEMKVKSPLKKKRSLNKKGKDDKEVVMSEATPLEVEVVETNPPVATQAGGSSPWNPLFNPTLFLEKMVDMTGNSSRFNNTPTDELIRMSLGNELKGLLMNYALATRQKQELATANDKMALVDKNLASIEKQYAATKETILAEVELLKSQHLEVMSKLAKAHEEELAKAKKDQDAAVKTAKALQEDLTAKEERLATLAKDNEATLSELAFLRQEKVKWEFEKESLEENIGTQYDEGFSYAIE